MTSACIYPACGIVTQEDIVYKPWRLAFSVSPVEATAQPKKLLKAPTSELSCTSWDSCFGDRCGQHNMRILGVGFLGGEPYMLDVAPSDQLYYCNGTSLHRMRQDFPQETLTDNSSMRRTQLWPATTKSVSKRLNFIVVNLKKCGIINCSKLWPQLIPI